MEIDKIISYPTRRDDWTRTVLLGGILVFFGFLLVPLFLVYGYVVRTVRESLAGSQEPPAFGDWGELLVDGVKAWLVSLVYLLVPLLVAAVTVGGAVAATVTGGEAGAAAGLGGLLVGFLVSTLLSLVFGYFAVVGIVNFAREGTIGAAFDVSVVKAVAFDTDYALAWLVSVVILLVASAVSAIPVLGWILTPFASFYAAVVAANLWADGFAQALESTTGVARPQDEEAAV